MKGHVALLRAPSLEQAHGDPGERYLARVAVGEKERLVGTNPPSSAERWLMTALGK